MLIIATTDEVELASKSRPKPNLNLSPAIPSDEDVEMADGEATSAAKKAKRKADPKFGHEFKAKVCFIRATG